MLTISLSKTYLPEPGSLNYDDDRANQAGCERTHKNCLTKADHDENYQSVNKNCVNIDVSGCPPMQMEGEKDALTHKGKKVDEVVTASIDETTLSHSNSIFGKFVLMQWQKDVLEHK